MVEEVCPHCKNRISFPITGIISRHNVLSCDNCNTVASGKDIYLHDTHPVVNLCNDCYDTLIKAILKEA